MRRKLAIVLMGLVCWGFADKAEAQYYAPYQVNLFWYYPYHFYPHNYWPSLAPRYPEQPYGAPYQRPPAYMAYPPFLEPTWRYELWSSQRYYRGSHFWLDQF